MCVKKSNEKMFCSPELGAMIGDDIARHKMAAFLRHKAGMRQSVVEKLKRGNWTTFCRSTGSCWPCDSVPVRMRWRR